jgi:hypothetical protein
MIDVSRETTNFVRACEAIHGLLAHESLKTEDRDLIEFSCLDLLSKVKTDHVVQLS